MQLKKYNEKETYQKQPSKVFCRKMSSSKFGKIHSQTPVTKFFLMKLQAEVAYNFIKTETLVQVFSCEFFETYLKIFLQNTSGQLLLPYIRKIIGDTVKGFKVRIKKLYPIVK